MKFEIHMREREGGDFLASGIEFAEGPQAANYVKIMNKLHAGAGEAVRCKVVKVASTEPIDPRMRVVDRLVSGELSQVPWSKETWYQVFKPEHICHVDPENPTLVRYFDVRDRMFISVTPGRYLNRYADAYLSPEQISKHVVRMIYVEGGYEVRYARTADEIEDIYTTRSTGPQSCLRYPIDCDDDDHSWESSVHPARVYAGPDLCVAYLYDTKEGRAVGRVLVWEERKFFGRLYGETYECQTILGDELEKLGFTGPKQLNASRILRVFEDGHFVLPYIDLSRAVDDNGEYLVINADGDINGESQSGWSEYEVYDPCPNCGSQGHGGSVHTVAVDPEDLANVEEYCDECGPEKGYCTGFETYVLSDTFGRYFYLDYKRSWGLRSSGNYSEAYLKSIGLVYDVVANTWSKPETFALVA